MRLPQARFTVRRMMVGVAILGSLAGVEAMRRRSHDLRERAEFHKWEIYAIEEELPPDPDKLWEAYWFSDDPNRYPPVGRFCPAGWSPPSDDDPPQIAEWRVS
jgi:hypothetical protein